jgi:tetratricopeptide (TPR) repeat protein
VLTFVSLGAAASLTEKNSQLPLDQGFRQMYNLDFPAAHATFRAHQAEVPEDPMGYVSNAAAYLFSEFDRLHILETDLFTDDRKFEGRDKLTPDPAVKMKFENELAKSDELANRVLAQNPDDRNALFALLMANGLRADYTGLIEKRNLASLGYMKTARIIAQKLLAIDRTCYDAYLAVGVENYLLGLNPAPIRWVLRLTGAQTDKQEGLERLRLTADKGHYLAPFARLLLAVAALRDKDRQTARTLLAELAKEFPRNQLYATELARLR